ncbi:hypothetical protein ID866_2744 [Astraeus odoratus]|nr:hypothetical protein ID866_2744 [Astraeus odoratus]
MDQSDWAAILDGHPIFDGLSSFPSRSTGSEEALELSTNSLRGSFCDNKWNDGYALSGRRQVMALKDADLIVAVGSELRMTSLGDARLGKSTRSYKVQHAQYHSMNACPLIALLQILQTPNIEFDIHQISPNPNGKLLAIAGAYQVAVVVLPRAGYSKLVSTFVDCKSVQVGQFYHGSRSSIPIAKIEWHPWGEAASTLMVMTADGKLREYDISVDTEEPQQVLSFLPEKKSKSFMAEDPAEREIASFTLGKGRADWGPLTIYVVTRSGDIYAICPYMPKNASIPSSYIHALECFISAKQEFLAQGTVASTSALSTLYDYQRKYVSALIKQLPPGTVFPAISRPVPMHPPQTIKSDPLRQGPFLLQPSPRILDGSEGGDASDIAYLAFINDDDDENDGETERLGIVVVTYQDGKVDVCLDVEKVEARWESKRENSQELPMIAVYESIDLGFITMLGGPSTTSSESAALELLQANHPVLLLDPIHDDRVYIYHAFGVHVLEFGELLQCLATALRADDEDGAALRQALEQSMSTRVTAMLNTYSVQRKCSNPVIAVCVPNDVFLTYSMIILTSVFRVTCLPLTLRTGFSCSEESLSVEPDPSIDQAGEFLTAAEGPPPYISLLASEPFRPSSALTRPSGFPSFPRMSVGTANTKSEFMLTPDTLRYFGSTVEGFIARIREVLLAHRATETRANLQRSEYKRQQEKCVEMLKKMEELKGPRCANIEARVLGIMESHKALMTRLDRTLQSLMQQASPELSESETKWFEELRRMKSEVQGTGRYDENSLVARVSLLKREYERSIPNLRDVVEKEAQRKKRLSDNSQLLGVSQAFELGEHSTTERTKITELEREIVRMASELELSVGRPPSQRDKPDASDQ